MPQPAASGHRLWSACEELNLKDWPGQGAGCLGEQGTQLAEGEEPGLRREAVLTLTVCECSYTLPSLFFAVVDDDIS